MIVTRAGNRYSSSRYTSKKHTLCHLIHHLHHPASPYWKLEVDSARTYVRTYSSSVTVYQITTKCDRSNLSTHYSPHSGQWTQIWSIASTIDEGGNLSIRCILLAATIDCGRYIYRIVGINRLVTLSIDIDIVEHNGW